MPSHPPLAFCFITLKVPVFLWWSVAYSYVVQAMEHLGICYSPLRDIKVLKVAIRCLVFEILVFKIHDVVFIFSICFKH